MTARIMIIGAHPDDAEFHVGGLMVLWRRAGFAVTMLSVTDGAAGHHLLTPDQVAATRRAELAESAALNGIGWQILPYPDGELMASLAARRDIITAVRKFVPDLLITHRPNDYHPDHRAVGQLVQDASFMVRVPLAVPEVPALVRDPVVAYMADFFSRPNPFKADIAVNVGTVMDDIILHLNCHRSQVYEWLPHLDGVAADVPDDVQQRIAWLTSRFSPRPRAVARRCRDTLERIYGAAAAHVEYAEALEWSEYGSRANDAFVGRLFPFLADSHRL